MPNITAGDLLFGGSLAVAIGAGLLLVFGFQRWLLENELATERGAKIWNYGLHIALVLPFMALLSRFLVADMSYHYVWLHGGEDLPLRYRFAAVWAAREGPLLLWAAFVGFLAFIWRKRANGEGVNQHRTRLRLMHGMALFLLLLAACLDPFRKTTNPDWASPGLNALLQTDLMVIHPPMIFLFYSLCIAIGATALSVLLNNDEGTKSLKQNLLKYARPAILFGTLSIGLGGLWAYTVLDWGGYWAWDPVETGSLLPWLAVVILLHLPLRPGKVDDGVYIAAGIATTAFAIFATMVTRASGVWASSVHTFVTADEASKPTDAWGRLVSLTGDSTAGVEVIAYLLLLLLLVSLLCSWLIGKSIDKGLPEWVEMTLLIAPLPPMFAWLFIEEGVALWEDFSGIGIAILGTLPLLVSVISMRNELWKRLTLDPIRLPLLVGSIAIAFWNGDAIIGGVGIVLMLLLVTRTKPDMEYGLITAGIVFHLFSAWSQLSELAQSGSAMALFLIPMFLNEPPEPEEKRSLFTKSGQMRVVYQTPSTMVALFLLLSWVLLLNSLDRTQLEAHELYGAPIITLLATGMMVYGWRDRVESRMIPWLICCVAALSAILAWEYGDALPGDVDDVFAGPLTRGQLAWLILPTALITLPAMGLEVWSRGKKWLDIRRGDGRNASSHSRKSRAALAGMGAHMVHLGLLLLLVGHIFATTLVERSAISHRLSLSQDDALIEDDLALVFTELKLLSEGDEEFDSRFDVGSRYVGVVVEVYDANSDGTRGDFVATMEPGVLSFDNGFDRSEVATLSRATGDFILIFDLSQANELGMAMVLGEIDDVERIRVTAYNLPGSHLVWIGWTLMLLGMALTWQSWWPVPKIGDEKSYVSVVEEE